MPHDDTPPKAIRAGDRVMSYGALSGHTDLEMFDTGTVTYRHPNGNIDVRTDDRVPKKVFNQDPINFMVIEKEAR